MNVISRRQQPVIEHVEPAPSAAEAVDMQRLEEAIVPAEEIVPPVPDPARVEDFAPDAVRLESGKAPRAGELSAEAVKQCCRDSAGQVTAAADTIMAMAESVQAEARALAENIIACGELFGARIEKFTTLTAQTRQAMKTERERLSAFAIIDTRDAGAA
jgi:hypothetical protein